LIVPCCFCKCGGARQPPASGREGRLPGRMVQMNLQRPNCLSEPMHSARISDTAPYALFSWLFALFSLNR
jgi:hypothetical protein